jgi:hypothetical protein
MALWHRELRPPSQSPARFCIASFPPHSVKSGSASPPWQSLGLEILRLNRKQRLVAESHKTGDQERNQRWRIHKNFLHHQQPTHLHAKAPAHNFHCRGQVARTATLITPAVAFQYAGPPTLRLGRCISMAAANRGFLVSGWKCVLQQRLGSWVVGSNVLYGRLEGTNWRGPGRKFFCGAVLFASC